LALYGTKINESTNQRINESTNQRINESTNQRINESTNQIVIALKIRLFWEQTSFFILKHEIKRLLGTLKKQVITIARENKPNCYNLFFERSLLLIRTIFHNFQFFCIMALMEQLNMLERLHTLIKLKQFPTGQSNSM
jgi:hypothetical protein